MAANQYVNSDRVYSRYVSDADADYHFPIRHYHFVLVLGHPIDKPEKLLIKYWEINGSGGIGLPPPPRDLEMELEPTGSFPQRFKLQVINNEPKVISERD